MNAWTRLYYAQRAEAADEETYREELIAELIAERAKPAPPEPPEPPLSLFEL